MPPSSRQARLGANQRRVPLCPFPHTTAAWISASWPQPWPGRSAKECTSDEIRCRYKAEGPLIGKPTACPKPLRQSLWENTDWLRARSTAVSCRQWMVGGHLPTRAMHRSGNCAPTLLHLVVRDQHFRSGNGSVAPAKTQARPLNEAAPLAISVG